MPKKKSITEKKRPGKDGRFDIQDWARGHHDLLLVAALALYTVFSLLVFDPKPFVGGDNAAYVSLSKSLAQGKGLSEIWTPEAKPHTQYPFGFPLLLAPVSALKLSYAWYKLIPWLAGFLVLLVFWMILGKNANMVRVLSVLLLSVNPFFLDYTHWVLSELPFMFFVMLSFLLLKKWEGKGGFLWLVMAMAAAVFANHIRSAGLALYLGIFLFLLFKRRYKESMIFLAGCIILTLPWALRNSHYGTSGGYLDQFLMRDPYQPELGYLSLGGLAQRFLANGKIYFSKIMPWMLFPSLETWGIERAILVVMMLAVVPALAVLAYRIAKIPESYDWFALAYLGMSLLWPETWSDIRFLLPLLPFLLFYMIQAYAFLIRILFKKNLWMAAGLSIIIIATNISAGGQVISENLAANKNYSRDKYSGYGPAWRSFFAAAEWIKSNTPANSIVVSRKPTLFYLGSDRKSYCYPFTADQDSMLKSIDKADYVMVEPVSGTGQKFLIPSIQPLIDKKYKIIYSSGNPPTYVLQVMKEVQNAR